MANGKPSADQVEYTIITGVITSAIGVFLGIIINEWWSGFKSKRGGMTTAWMPPGMGS